MEKITILTRDQIEFGLCLLREYVDRTNGFDPDNPEKEERNSMARQLHNALFDIGHGRMVVSRSAIDIIQYESPEESGDI